MNRTAPMVASSGEHDSEVVLALLQWDRGTAAPREDRQT
jgi:hypothetical protein